MPELSDLPALDVAIGVAFLYFILSIVASSVSELIASIFRIRAKNLEAGVRALLGSQTAADKFYEHWRIDVLHTPKWRDNDKKEKSRKPSYIAPRTFALALLDTFAPDAHKTAAQHDPTQKPSANQITALKAEAAKIENPFVKERVEYALDHARGSIDELRTELEGAFNDVMDRATGWYKRKVQIILAVIALVVAGGLNADTFNVADRLARDDTLRASVTAQALKAVEAEQPKTTDPTPADVKAQIAQARATGLPLGWNAENKPDDAKGWLIKIGGLLMTAAAIMLGAPFWFDVLGRLARLRSTGNRVGTPKDDDLAPTDRDARRR